MRRGRPRKEEHPVDQSDLFQTSGTSPTHVVDIEISRVTDDMLLFQPHRARRDVYDDNAGSRAPAAS